MEPHDFPNEFSLGKLLSHRRWMHADEIPLLLAELPRLLDGLENPESIGSLLADVFVVFSKSEHSSDTLIKSRVENWPAFGLELRVGEVSGTVVTARGRSPFARDLPTRLAGLIYELVGGHAQTKGGDTFHYSPVAGLGEEANLTLQEMLTVGDYADCKALWHRWLQKSGQRWRPKAIPDLYIPKWALKFGRPGAVMEFVPKHPRQLPIRFVARDEFRIGRSRRAADLPVRVFSAKAENERSEHLSRTHVTARLTDEGIKFQDGDGITSSANGTMLAGERLNAQRGRLLDQATELILAGVCRLKIEPLPSPALNPLSIANLHDWHGIQEVARTRRQAPFAAIAFRAAGDTLVLREAVWLFTGIGLRVVKTGALECGVQGTPEFSCFHEHGCFWLACLKQPPEQVSADDAVLAPGQIMPLDEQLLDFGQQRFTCRVLE